MQHWPPTVFVHREDLHAIRGLPNDFENRSVFGNKIETNLLRHKGACQLKDMCARSLFPNSEASCFNSKAYFLETNDRYFPCLEIVLKINQSL